MATPNQPDPRDIQKLIDLYQQVDRLTRSQAENMAQISANAGNINKEIERLQKELSSVEDSFSSIAQSLKDSIQEFSKYNTTATNTKKTFSSLQSIASKLLSDQSGYSVLSEKELKRIKEKIALEAQNLAQNISSGNLTAEQATEANDVLSKTAQLLKLTEERLKKEKETNAKLGLSGKIVDGIVGTLGKLGISSEFFENLKENMRDAAETAGSSKWSVFKTGLTGIGKGLKEALKDPITQLTILKKILEFIYARANQFNKISVDIGKNLGTGTEQSDKITQNLASAANYSTNLNFTLKNAGEAMSDLNSATGGVAEYSADTLETQIMLTKQFGLTGEEAAGLYKFSVLTGKASSKINDEMVAAFASTRNMVKGSANFKTTIAEVAKVSGQLAVNFRNNPAEITKAVVQAQALGTTLEKAKSQGEKLLDFESSISNELEAELLTGQQMNLERARAAALAGDQVTVMKELVNQGMTLEKFSSMNVIAQQSYAKALGLSADELSEQLRKQKIAQEQGKSLAEITAEEAKEAEKRQAIQDKFNAAVEKLQDIVGNLVGGPFAVLLDMLSEALKLIGYIVQPFQFIYDLGKKIGDTIGGWLGALGVVGKILKTVAGVAIILAAYSAAASVASVPIVGWALAPLVAAGMLGAGFGLLNSKKAGDIVSPAEGKTQVSTKEGGLFELSKNDDLVAGPGIAGKIGKGGKDGESIAPQIDLTPMIVAINEVKTSIDKLYNKDTSINMDGKKVGTTLVQGSYKVA